MEPQASDQMVELRDVQGKEGDEQAASDCAAHDISEAETKTKQSALMQAGSVTNARHSPAFFGPVSCSGVFLEKVRSAKPPRILQFTSVDIMFSFLHGFDPGPQIGE